MNWSTARATDLKPSPLHDSEDVKGSLDEHCPCSQVTLGEVHKWLLAAHSICQLSFVEWFTELLHCCSITMRSLLKFAPALSSMSPLLYAKPMSALQLASHLLELVALCNAPYTACCCEHHAVDALAARLQMCNISTVVLGARISCEPFSTSGLGGHSQLKSGSCKRP